MTPLLCEGSESHSLWLTDDGFEIRSAEGVYRLGHDNAEFAVAELDREQRLADRERIRKMIA